MNVSHKFNKKNEDKRLKKKKKLEQQLSMHVIIQCKVLFELDNSTHWKDRRGEKKSSGGLSLGEEKKHF